MKAEGDSEETRDAEKTGMKAEGRSSEAGDDGRGPDWTAEDESPEHRNESALVWTPKARVERNRGIRAQGESPEER